MTSRFGRLLLVASIVGAAAGLALSSHSATQPSESVVNAAPEPDATAFALVATPLPGIARDAWPPSAATARQDVYQGGALRLTVTDARTASATFLGQQVVLGPVSGGLVTYLGVPPDTATGTAAVSVQGTDLVGEDFDISLAATILKTNWTVDYIVLPPGVGGGLTAEVIEAENRLFASIYAQVSAPAWDIPWLSPVSPETKVSGYFGEQRSFDGSPPTGHHGGTDYAAAAGEPARATNGGTVVLARELDVRGRTVIIDHGGGVHSAYCHLETFLVAPGDQVVPGQTVGLVGTTGLSTGPHLHWEMAVNGVLVDGLRWLDGTQGF